MSSQSQDADTSLEEESEGKREGTKKNIKLCSRSMHEAYGIFQFFRERDE